MSRRPCSGGRSLTAQTIQAARLPQTTPKAAAPSYQSNRRDSRRGAFSGPSVVPQEVRGLLARGIHADRRRAARL
ncbi:hypothetical protein TUSST3_69130 [Streptomyces sp. TUS-ST3]|nr:hypothetical protein TUSST3_69130 [Streptomyces sp. TUS-ST3]